MLVSYDNPLDTFIPWFLLQGHQNVGELRHRKLFVHLLDQIAGSPECWWVTTYKKKHWDYTLLLQGHQNVGELRPRKIIFPVTPTLQGHQNVGELRQLPGYIQPVINWLQGHQNVGELRRVQLFQVSTVINCRVTRMLVSYDIKDCKLEISL